MVYLKILGGAAIGVGAIAAAPFTGGGSILGAASLATSLAGAGTIAAATGAGVTGAAAGKFLSNKEEEKVQEKFDKQKVKHELEKKEIISMVSSVLKDTTKFYEYVIAMHAIGLATANIDGHISEEELQEIEEFVSGIMSSKLPANVKNQIRIMAEDPPSLSTAFEFLKRADMTEMGWKDVDDLIELVIIADGYEDEKELEFKKSWQMLRKTA
jgi:hypothetical protein